MNRLVYLFFGALFGFILSRARATDYDAIVGMFRFTDLHLMGVIGGAIVVAAVGLRLFGPPLRRKPMHRWVFAGGLVFGTGWALTGACPGTVLSQIGEGKLYALVTLAGILIGTWIHGMKPAPGPVPTLERTGP